MDPHQLTRQLLETLPQCSEELQQEIVTFLPEVAEEDDLQAPPPHLCPLALLRGSPSLPMCLQFFIEWSLR